MNILYLGNSLPPKIYSTFAKDCKGRGSLAQHNYERSVMKGLSQQEGISAKALLVPWVGTYPISYTHLFTHSEDFELNGMPVHSVGYCHLALLNKWSRRHRLVGELLKIFDSFDGDTIHVFVVTYKYDMLVALEKAKLKTNKHITQTVYMLDQPGFDFESRKDISEWRKKRMRKDLGTTMRLTGESDSLAMVTEYFNDLFKRQLPHIVIEGMVDVEVMAGAVESKSAPTSNNKVILYTGTLKKIYGIMNLVEAFEKANLKDAELWICGNGEAAADITERGKTNPRIKYLGLLSSQESWRKQREATVLVNPRTSDGEYTKYSFPSKNFEYLLSGKPVIVNRLPGIPKEYDNYFFYPEDESVDALAACLKKVLTMPENERKERGEKGRHFIVEEKNAKVQVGKIIDLIRQIK